MFQEESIPEPEPNWMPVEVLLNVNRLGASAAVDKPPSELSSPDEVYLDQPAGLPETEKATVASPDKATLKGDPLSRSAEK